MMHGADGVLVPFDFASILQHLPILKNLNLDMRVVSFETPIDSSNIHPDHWLAIAHIIRDHYAYADGFVVLHGTDTMAFTASALSFMLKDLSKPVVFTGAQLPISEARSDARENLITSLDIASTRVNGIPSVPEVCIYFDSTLLRGNRSKKVESLQFHAFDSGNYPPLAKAGVKIDFNLSLIRQPHDRPLQLLDKIEPAIIIAKIFPGMTHAAWRSMLHTSGLKAVVLETYGSGNAPTLAWLVCELKSAIERGVLIVNISQCAGGRVLQGRYETSKVLEEIGVISGADMTTEAAVTKLMVLLAHYPSETVRGMMSLPLAGELTPETEDTRSW